MKLEGRIAAVTGGSAGIGRGIAEAYLAEGASVAVMARNAEKAEKMLAEVGAGNRLIFIQGVVKLKLKCFAKPFRIFPYQFPLGWSPNGAMAPWIRLFVLSGITKLGSTSI